MPEQAQNTEGKPNKPRACLWFGLIVFALAAVLAACAAHNRGGVESLVSSLFGPPDVALAEQFEDKPDGPTFDHAAFDGLLRKHVDENGWIDYAGLKADASILDQYTAALAKAPLDKLGRTDRLAFLLNAYNAFTLKLIVENLPLTSIKDIPDAWDQVRWNAGGYTWSLNQIEHEQIRPNFVEPRIHFALVCAAIGCPTLRNEAFDPARLDAQLTAQSTFAHNHDTWLKFDEANNSIGLTKLYLWYGDDFAQVEGSVLNHAAKFNTALKAALAAGVEPDIDWLPYSWELNDKANTEPR